MRTCISYPSLLIFAVIVSGLFPSASGVAESCPALSFAAARFYDTGPSPLPVVVADFNGDGKPDLATANSYPDITSSLYLSVLLGNGDGTFQAAVNHGVSNVPTGIAVGDFNGDGKADLAVAKEDGNVSVLLGNGDGTFQAAVEYSAGSPTSIAVGDFNGDGKPDLAVTNSGGVSVLLGNGDGTFQAAVQYSAGSQAFSLVAGDFNGDGKSDLAVAATGYWDPNSAGYTNSGIAVLLGNGDGTFQNAGHYEVEGELSSPAVEGDFNGDRKSDLAVATTGFGYSNNAGYTNSGIAVLLGNGDGTFQTAVNYVAGEASRSVALGDFNRDGKPDLAVISFRGVSVLLGNSDGTFQTAVNYSTGSQLQSVVADDFNGDGTADLTVAYEYSNVSVLLGNGDGTFQIAVNYGTGAFPWSATVADFNADGKPDLAVSNEAGNVSVLLGNGDGTFQAAVNHGVGYGARGVAVGDFNGDGKPDLAVSNEAGNVSVLLGNGDGTFQAAVTFNARACCGPVAVGDFDGDGKSDLALGSIDGVSVLLGNGDGTFRSPVNNSTGDPSSVAIGDFNDDGIPDLAGANRDAVFVLVGNGDGTFQSAFSNRVGGYPFPVGVGDFNRNRKLDLAVANSDGILVWLGNGDGAFQDYISYRAHVANESAAVAVGDFNGDGKSDLAVAAGGEHNLSSGLSFGISVLLGNGDGTFQSAVNFSAGPNPISLAVGDFNADGKPDLAVPNFIIAGTVSILLNTCVSTGLSLTILRSNNTVTVSWPFPSSGFVLESTSNLSLTNWQRAVEIPTTNNGRLEITVPFNQAERYFRLRKP